MISTGRQCAASHSHQGNRSYTHIHATLQDIHSMLWTLSICCILFLPKFDISDSVIDSKCIHVASFPALQGFHKLEAGYTLKYAIGLSAKSLKPANFDRQEVKLAQQRFTSFVARGLIVHADAHSIDHAA